jgi:ribonucleoside-diphosphate reductase alpha chain
VHGFRNAQVTCLAPTGTIAFMMDCDTTGVEPELALVKHKQLVGGGSLRIANRTVPPALLSLGYDDCESAAVLAWLEEHGTVEGAPGLAAAHLPVFDGALPAAPGGRCIAPRGHLLMLAALQPLVSGAISKTINVPHDTTVEAIEGIFLDAWRLGLKAVAVYRDGCKRSQPVQAGVARARPGREPAAGAPTVTAEPLRPVRRRLPDERRAITHKLSIQGHEGYLTVGLYDDGRPGEIFLVMAKEGSTVSGLMDAVATAVSIALQHGVPLATQVEKLSHTRYEPSGFTRHRAIPYAKSLTDYVFRWLGWKFLPAAQRQALGIVEGGDDEGGAISGQAAAAVVAAAPATPAFDDAPACSTCGTLMTRNGSCYRCGNCGATSGCG